MTKQEEVTPSGEQRTMMTTDADSGTISTNGNDWPNRQPPPVESAACFFSDCAKCPDPASCAHGCHREMKARLLADIDNDGRYASLSTVRAAIADVLDAGDSENAGEWLFYSTEPDWRMDERRTRFMDAVCQRVKELQAPPFELDAGLQAKLAQRKDRTDG